MKSFATELSTLPGSSSGANTFIGGETAPAAAAAPAAKEEDDDEVDLFGSDEEEDAEAERVKAERVAAYNAKKANKPKAAAKVIFENQRLSISCQPAFTVRCHFRSQALG